MATQATATTLANMATVTTLALVSSLAVDGVTAEHGGKCQHGHGQGRVMGGGDMGESTVQCYCHIYEEAKLRLAFAIEEFLQYIIKTIESYILYIYSTRCYYY